jgi:hypothetical protein
MTPKVWGPPIWIFLHAFSVNISEEGYARVGGQFFSFLTRICRMLPCPDCAAHATKFISSVKVQTLKTKYDMANLLCHFHNSVNQRKKLPFFHNFRLAAYEKVNIVSAFNNFVIAFTLPSQRLMNESLHRKMLATQMTKFMSSVLVYFAKPTPVAPPPPPSPSPSTDATLPLGTKSIHALSPAMDANLPTGTKSIQSPSPATDPSLILSSSQPSPATMSDLEFEGEEHEQEEVSVGDFSTTVEIDHANITIEILVEDYLEEEEEETEEVITGSRFLMSL